MPDAMTAWYNDNDAYCAQWLRNLIAAGLLPAGEVDDRDMRDIEPDELRGYPVQHWFSGVGGWPLALRLASWPDDRPVWTASLPCQPFSAAGRAQGVGDKRHLWPAFLRHVRELRPVCVFGEQVGGKAGYQWLSGVQLDLAAEGYRLGAVDLPAAGIGAPHIRQRLFWVADAQGGQRGQPQAWNGRQMSTGRGAEGDGGLADAGRECGTGRRGLRDVGGAQTGNEGAGQERQRVRDAADDSSTVGGLGDALGPRPQGQRPSVRGHPNNGAGSQQTTQAGTADGGLGDTHAAGLEGLGRQTEGADQRISSQAGSWDDARWIECADGKARRVPQSSIFPLASGVSRRVAKLRAIGNSIVPPLAAEFVRAYMEAKENVLENLSPR